MPTLMPHAELLRRAVEWIAEQQSAHPARPLHAVLDEASMRFNLSPLDTEALLRLFAAEPGDQPSNTHRAVL